MKDSKNVSGRIVSFFFWTFLFLIMAVWTVVLIGAYWTYRDRKLETSKKLADINNCLAQKKDVNDIKKETDCFTEGLKVYCENISESETISFLFTIFSIAVVTGCGYFVSCLKDESERIEDKIKTVEIVAETAGKSLETRIGSVKTFVIKFKLKELLQRAELMSYLSRSSKTPEEFNSVCPPLRDIMRETKNSLRNRLNKRQLVTIADQRCELLNYAKRTLSNLKQMVIEHWDRTDAVSDIEKDLNEIIEILEDSQNFTCK